MKQITTACLTCPWKKGAKRNADGTIGGSTPTVYIGQSAGPFLLFCHSDKNYAGKATDCKTTGQCRGAAIFRTNIDVAKRMPKGILTLPEDTKNVFESREEFLAHYYNTDIELINNLFDEEDYYKMVLKEINDTNVKIQDL